MTTVRMAVMTGIAALGAGSAAVVPAAVAVASVHLTPFAQGSIVLSGQFPSPTTTAQCETPGFLGAPHGLACYEPFQLQDAYDLGPLFARGIDGRGETIVVVDAFGSPSIGPDLATFDQAFGLPAPPSFNVITPEGPITTTPTNCTATYSPSQSYNLSPSADLCSDYEGWTEETSLDVEWSHAMAPGANILLVEVPTTETEGIYGFPDIIAAENYVIANHLGDVITQSFGATEQTFLSPAQISSLESAYVNAQAHGVTVLSASGDQGSTDYYCSPSSGCADPDDVYCCYATRAIDWPASDPLVTAVGGTQLHLSDSGATIAPASVWNDASYTVGIPGPVYTWGAGGGGLSTVFSRPAFQNGVANIVGDSRGTPDIAMSAAVNGAVDFYDSTGTTGAEPSVTTIPAPMWSIVGGTSEASPLFSGIVALADQVAGHSLGYINPALYAMAEQGGYNGIVPVFAGTNTYTFCPISDYETSGPFAGLECDSWQDLVTVPGFYADGYYNDATGWGTVDAAFFVPALARAASGPPGPPGF